MSEPSIQVQQECLQPDNDDLMAENALISLLSQDNLTPSTISLSLLCERRNLLVSLQNSISWRITGPFRRIWKFFRGSK